MGNAGTPLQLATAKLLKAALPRVEGMDTPELLYRYRPLSDQLLDRELSALVDSYLYAPSFSEMNDPMEAFFQVGHALDGFVDAGLTRSGRSVAEIYALFRKIVEEAALVS